MARVGTCLYGPATACATFRLDRAVGGTPMSTWFHPRTHDRSAESIASAQRGRDTLESLAGSCSSRESTRCP
jgi:hypothetical protein